MMVYAHMYVPATRSQTGTSIYLCFGVCVDYLVYLDVRLNLGYLCETKFRLVSS